MPDSLTRLREADPAAHVRTDPPDEVLRAILAIQPERRPRRRAPRIVLAAATLAVAAVVAIAALPAGDTGTAPLSLAQRAYAATAPAPDFITYTETTTVQTGMPKLESRNRVRQWQYRDRMHNFMDTVQPRGAWTYEHDQNATTFRTLMRNDKGDTDFQITRKTDPGWDREELDEGFKAGVTTLVETFREQIRTAKDLGETTFNGRPARAYQPLPGKRRAPGVTTYYVDARTALPLGSTIELPIHKPKAVGGRLEQGEREGRLTIVTTVDRYEQLEPTPENLKLLDAPNIDAAQAR